MDDFRRTFNLGIGMVVAISPRKLAAAQRTLGKLGQPYYRIGSVVKLARGARSRVLYQ
jgi:phosphoribosylformylglycinamidine cyclo-ligase